MGAKQGSVSLLNDPVAQDLLQSSIPARLAYNWKDGTPRVVPIWFFWNGDEFVFGSPEKAPKLKALKSGAKLALTIDDNTFPHKVLLVRGTARVEMTNDAVIPEYAAAARRYFGEEQGTAWCGQVSQMGQKMARISMKPECVGVLDFQSRLPSAIPS